MRIITLLAALSAVATMGASPPRPPEPNLPQGSYQQSCRGASMRGSTLSAQCPQASGAPVFTSIDVNACRGRDIANDNGRLVCQGGVGPVPPRPPELPRGSYQQSCRGASMNGWTLSAQCPGRNGAPVFSSIETRACQGRDIANDYGRLVCGGGSVGPGPGPDPGHGRQGLRAYSGARYSGARLDVTAPRFNLSVVGFNDRIRSIRVDGGQWELCTDAYFRGRCVTVTQSSGNLNDIGMAGTISSIRPK